MCCRTLRHLAWLAGFVSAFLLAAPASSQDFLPDERVTSLMVRVKTADDWWASTLNDVLFSVSTNREWDLNIPLPEPGWADFMRGSQADYWLDPGTMLVENIRRIRIRKSIPVIDDDWKFGWLAVYVNGKLLYDSGEVNQWLNEGNPSWTAPDFAPVSWPELRITTLDIPDTGPNTDYSAVVTAEGGRGPYTWSAECTYHDGSWSTMPSCATINPTSGRITGRTSSREGDTGITVTARDSRGETVSRYFSVEVLTSMGPPTIVSFTPTYGWPASLGEIPASRIDIRGTNFDCRAPGNTTVRFGAATASIVSIGNRQIIAEVPPGAVDGPITVTTPFGTATSTQRFNVHPYGYRWRYGYSFANAGTDELSWDVFRDLFGSAQVEWMTPIGLVPKPAAGIFYLAAFKHCADGGNCHGFSLSSLRFQHGQASLSQYRPSGADALWELESGLTSDESSVDSGHRLGRLINLNQGAHQGLESLIHDATNNRADDPVRLLNEVRSQLVENREGQIHITRSDGAGHSLLPYAIADLPSGISLIRVYDSNKPFRAGEASDHDSALVIDRNANTWHYVFDDVSTWSGPHLDAAPYSVYPTTPTLLTDAIDDILFFGIPGDARVAQLSDDAGRTFYTDTGQVNQNPKTRLPRATRVGPLSPNPDGYPDAYFIAPDPTTKKVPAVTAEIVAKGKTDSKYTAAVLLKGGAFVISNVTTGPGLRDRIEVDADAGQLSFTASGSQTDAWVDLVRRVPSDDPSAEQAERVFSLAKVTMGPGDRLQIRAGKQADGLSVRAFGKSAARFSLLSETIGESGKTRRVLGEVSVAAGSTQTFSLPLVGEARRLVDRDSDGVPETTEKLVLTDLPYAAKYGDLNRDGQVTPVDAALGLRFAAGSQIPDDDQRLRADVYPREGTGDRPVGDGRVTVEDAVELLKVVVGLSAPLGTTDDSFARPASYPRLPDPLPSSPPPEIRAFTHVPIASGSIPISIQVPPVIVIPPLVAVPFEPGSD